MRYGICNLSLIGVRDSRMNDSSIGSELFYGEGFEIINELEDSFYIRELLGSFEGWVYKNQVKEIGEDEEKALLEGEVVFCGETVYDLNKEDDEVGNCRITYGSVVSRSSLLGNEFKGEVIRAKYDKDAFDNIISVYLDSPYRAGGQSIFGVDSQGLIQMVYRLMGIDLERYFDRQKEAGYEVELIDMKKGDLVFFKNMGDDSGEIVHGGLVYQGDEYNIVVHSNGRVRADQIVGKYLQDYDTEEYIYEVAGVYRIKKDGKEIA